MVSSKKVARKTIAEMHFVGRYQCWLTRVSRSGIDMPRRPDLELQLGDVLVLTGPRSQLEALAEEMGYSEAGLRRTDLVSFTFGIAIGVLIGMLSVTVGGIRLSLGTAGGTLLAGLAFGILHSRVPTLARFPVAARNILMELGLMIFMSNVAVSAGSSIVDTIRDAGPSLALCGVCVTLVPPFLCLLVGRYLFRMNGAILMGSLTGAMTSTPSLNQVVKLSKSSVPTLGYVGTYAFANVLLAVAGTFIMLL
jgi:putative transport protein